MIASKSTIKGQITAKVLTLDEEGKQLFEQLKVQFKRDEYQAKVKPLLQPPAERLRLGVFLTPQQIDEEVQRLRKEYRYEEYCAARGELFDKHGFIKRKQNWWQKLLGLPGTLMISVTHNIVTDEGDALIADLMQETPARVKVNNTNGRIAVGTGWTGTTPKTNTWVNTITGAAEALDATYPKLKGAFGAANDNVVQYRSTFEAGDLNAVDIDEAVLANGATDGAADSLAYGNVLPNATVGTSDTLQVDWEITLLGS